MRLHSVSQTKRSLMPHSSTLLPAANGAFLPRNVAAKIIVIDLTSHTVVDAHKGVPGADASGHHYFFFQNVRKSFYRTLQKPFCRRIKVLMRTTEKLSLNYVEIGPFSHAILHYAVRTRSDEEGSKGRRGWVGCLDPILRRDCSAPCQVCLVELRGAITRCAENH